MLFFSFFLFFSPELGVTEAQSFHGGWLVGVFFFVFFFLRVSELSWAGDGRLLGSFFFFSFNIDGSELSVSATAMEGGYMHYRLLSVLSVLGQFLCAPFTKL